MQQSIISKIEKWFYIPSPKLLFLILWLEAIFFFLFALFYLITHINTPQTNYFKHLFIATFLASAVIGSLAFLAMLISLIFKSKTNSPTHKVNLPKKNLSFGSIIVLFGLLIFSISSLLMPTIEVSEGTLVQNNTQNEQIESKIEPISSLSTIPLAQTTNISPTQTPVIANDPDPIVNCKFTESGIKQMHQSQCSKSFDCEIGDRYYIYSDRNKCSEDQKTYWTLKLNPSSNKPASVAQIVIPCITSLGSNFGYGNTQQDAEQNCRDLQLKAQSMSTQITQNAQVFGQWLNQDFQKSSDQSSPKSNEIAKQNCINDAAKIYAEQSQQALAKYGGGSSASEAIKAIAKEDYDRKVNQCNNL